MEWKEEYALGIPVIDAQHKQLFRLCAELDAVLKSGVKAEDIDALLVRIREYAARHFTMEEKYMAESNFPGVSEQKMAHQGFIASFQEVYDDFHTNGLSREIVEGIQRQLSGWVRKHVTGMDQQFGKYYKKEC